MINVFKDDFVMAVMDALLVATFLTCPPLCVLFAVLMSKRIVALIKKHKNN